MLGNFHDENENKLSTEANDTEIKNTDKTDENPETPTE